MKIPIVKMMNVVVNLYDTLIIFWHEHGANENYCNQKGGSRKTAAMT
jgi:hypothetical protein